MSQPRPFAAPSSAPDAQRVTISDVALKAGVSKATVSRFLNRREELLTPEIALRVERAISALCYTPSPMAQALKRGRSRLIGMVMADLTDPCSVAVLRGAEKACQAAGYLPILFNVGNESGRTRDAVQALCSYQVEGLILNTSSIDESAFAQAMRHGPVVLVDRPHGGMQADLVSLDHTGAVRLAASHLLDSAYRELLFISEPLSGVASRIEREAAFRAFVSEHAAAGAGRTFESTAEDVAGLDSALRTLRQRAGGRRPAVLCSNAAITLRVVAAAARLGWRFGPELGLVGLDETEWAPLIGPGLSTIVQPADDLGRLAASCLFERLSGFVLPPRRILVPGHLMERGSSRLYEEVDD